MASLTLEDVDFAYKNGRPVFRSFNFAFDDGSTLLLGPNGAGKSTLLGLCASILTPRNGSVSAGAVRASGRDLRTFRGHIAFMPQRIKPMPGLTSREQVAYVGWLKGLSRDEAWKGAKRALERVDMARLGDRRPRTLSGGELRRLGVAQTLVHKARWILMDEPTAGLDPAQRAEFQSLASELRSDVDLVISTHQTEDIGTIYDRVVVLDAGDVRFSGTTDRFLGLGDGPAGSSQRVVSAYQRALTLPPV
jgi:ABC-2 type transport system ATP-binding protein